MSQQDGQEKNDSEKKQPKAVALLSGGLDSSLAVRMMLEQGVDVEAVAIKTPFCDFDCGKGCGHRVKEVADELGRFLRHEPKPLLQTRMLLVWDRFFIA